MTAIAGACLTLSIALFAPLVARADPLACVGQKTGDRKIKTARQGVERGKLYTFAVKTFGPPTACSVKAFKTQGQTFRTFIYTFDGGELEDGTRPPESSRTYLKATNGFADPKAAEATLHAEASSTGMKIDWTQLSEKGDLKQYQDPDTKGHVLLQYEHGKLMAIAVSKAL